MRTLKYFIIGLIVIIASCSEDMVHLTNPNEITSGQFWQSQNDAVLGTNAIYQALIYDGTYMRFLPWILDIRADDALSTTPGYYPEAVANYTVDAGNIAYSYPWQHHYIGVWRANQVLDNIPGIEMNEVLKSRLIGEAKFLRGVFYFNLLNLFRNVVLYTETPSSVDDYYIPQSPPDVVWAQVIQDFTDAIEGLWEKGESKAGFTNNVGRATKASAAAFLAKSLMINQRFGEAAPLLKDIIDGEYGVYGLVPDYRDNFTENNQNNIESIFEIQYDLNVGGSVQGFDGDPSPDWLKSDAYNKTVAPLPIGWGDVAPNPWIYEKFQEERTIDDELDPRMEASLIFPHDDDTSYTVYGRPNTYIYELGFAWPDVVPDEYYVFIRKHITEDEELDNSWRSGINRRLFRYADVLLLYAECLNETGQTANAYPYIQEVRDRANLPDLSVVKPNMTYLQMKEQIEHERLLELCFEAWRYIDLLRWGYFDDLDKVEILRERDAEFDNWSPGREYMAIPPTELERNANMVQNEGWN